MAFGWDVLRPAIHFSQQVPQLNHRIHNWHDFLLWYVVRRNWMVGRNIIHAFSAGTTFESPNP